MSLLLQYLKDLQSSIVSLRHRDYHFNDDSPNSFLCAVLLNANRAGSTGKWTNTAWGPRQVRANLNLKIVRLPAGPAQSTFSSLIYSVTKWNRGSAMSCRSPCRRLTYHKCESLTHSERRPQNIYSKEEMNLYCNHQIGNRNFFIFITNQ